MVQTVIEVAAGALLALGLILLARWWRRELLVYGVGLIVAAAVYPVAAAVAGAWEDAGVEALGLALFGLAGVFGLRGRPWLLAAGWALHAVWDVGLYVVRGRAIHVHSWYPTLCAGFDLVLAGYLVGLALRLRGARS